MTNLELLIGPFDPSEESDYEGKGSVAAIAKNMKVITPLYLKDYAMSACRRCRGQRWKR